MHGEYEESLALFREIERASGATDGAFHLNAGQTALALGESELGLRWLERALADRETRADAFLSIVRFRLSAGDWTGAQRALADPPPELRSGTETLRLRAVARYRTGDLQGAMQDLEAVLTIDPSDTESRRRLEALREEAPRR